MTQVEGDAQWLAAVVDACDRGLARLRAVEAPPRDLLRDLVALRARVEAERAALERPGKSAP